MDATSVIGIVVGAGISLATMAIPLKYRSAPPAVYTAALWIGVAVAVTALAYPLFMAVLPAAFTAIASGFSNAAAVQVPAYAAVVLALLAVVAVRWGPPVLARAVAFRRRQRTVVHEWLPPRAALFAFCAPELIDAVRESLERRFLLDERVRQIEERLQGSAPGDQSDALKAELDERRKQASDAASAWHEHSASLIYDMRRRLIAGELVAKVNEATWWLLGRRRQRTVIGAFFKLVDFETSKDGDLRPTVPLVGMDWTDLVIGKVDPIGHAHVSEAPEAR